MKTVVIAGGSGLVGRRLSVLLREAGYEVLWLSRRANPKAEFPTFGWNPATGELDAAPLLRADFIINLAGSGIADQRWTAARKRDIIESRTQSADLLHNFLQNNPSHRVKAYVAASAIGFYGERGDDWLIESATAGDGFLAESTAEWEAATHRVGADTGVRTVALRVGIVLSVLGGALPKILMSFPFRLGIYFGSGRQFYSWIHIDDVARMFQFSLENTEIQGVFNAVSPNPVDNRTLTQNVGVAKNKSILLIPAPSFALRLILGEMETVVLNSDRVSPKKIMDSGFKFQFPESIAALKDILKRKI